MNIWHLNDCKNKQEGDYVYAADDWTFWVGQYGKLNMNQPRNGEANAKAVKMWHDKVAARERARQFKIDSARPYKQLNTFSDYSMTSRGKWF